MSRADENDAEWSGWKREFTAGAAEAPPLLDVGELEKKVRRGTIKTYFHAVNEVFGSLLVVGFYAVVILEGSDTVVLSMAAVTYAALVVWLGYMFHVRKGTWSAAAKSTADYLALLVRRREADVLWRRFGRAWMAFFAIVIAAWAPFVLAANREKYSAEPWRALVGFGVAYLIIVIVWIHNGRKLEAARRELSVLKSIEP